jgi:hypothetical protein
MALTAESTYTKSYRGRVLDILIRRIADNSIIAGQPPNNLTIENGIAATMKTGVSGEGLETNVGVNRTEYKPTATLAFGRSNLQLLAFQQGYATRSLTAKIIVPLTQQALGAFYAPVPSGKRGFGVAVDTPTRGWIQDPETGLSVILAQQPFATFSPATPNSFAVGANFARKYSNDIVARRAFVSLAPTANLPVTTISEEELGYLEINAVMVNDDNTLDYLVIPTATVDPSGSGINPQENNLQVKLICAAIGRCRGYDLYSSQEQLFCETAAA